MRIVFARHGAPLSGTTDPPLSEGGERMADAAREWLASNGIVADHCLVTPTRRTRETARSLLERMPHVRQQLVDELPESLADWERLVSWWSPRIGSHGVLLLVGHHPTLDLLLSTYGPAPVPVPPGVYATTLVLDRVFTGSWAITGTWPGQQDPA